MMFEQYMAILKRDADSDALWFTGPESFTSLAVRDRRSLIVLLLLLSERLEGQDRPLLT